VRSRSDHEKDARTFKPLVSNLTTRPAIVPGFFCSAVRRSQLAPFV
jgi:hypothetical protein